MVLSTDDRETETTCASGCCDATTHTVTGGSRTIVKFKYEDDDCERERICLVVSQTINGCCVVFVRYLSCAHQPIF